MRREENDIEEKGKYHKEFVYWAAEKLLTMTFSYPGSISVK